MSLKRLHAEVKKHTDPAKGKFLRRFFRTGRGEYGYDDVFAGLNVPTSRIIAKKFSSLNLSELSKLLKSKIHEERLIALLILVDQFHKGSSKTKKKIYQFYLNSTKYVNNWDLVDLSAHKIVGAYIYNKDAKVLNKLARSKSLWERRIAMISTAFFISKKDFSKTIEIAKMLLLDKHDLIHKAVGWMLREAGKKDERVLTKFLDKHYRAMPRTALRYAIERLKPKQKVFYMKK